MKENLPDESKNKWSRIFKKKWFFPTLYLAIAALLLTGVIWYQNVENRMSEGLDSDEITDNYAPGMYDEDAEAVLQQQEVIKMPVEDEAQAEIVTKFYDYNADTEEQENGLILYNNRYYQSTGIDIATEDGEPFAVIASLSGTVEEVKEDPLLGNVVILTHESDVKTYYASLGEVEVKAGEKVKQGEKIGTAGKSLFNQESGTHVHFEIRKDDLEVNPEMFFNEPLSALEEFDANEQAEEEQPEASEDQEEQLESDTDADSEDATDSEEDEEQEDEE